MPGSVATVALVFGRILATGTANVLQKRLLASERSSLVLMVWLWSWMTLMTCVAWWPSLVNWTHARNLDFWYWMILACLLETPGNWMLLRSLQRTDLSIYGPLNSFKPAVSLVFAIVILGEIPTPLGILGMAIVLIGSLYLTDTSASLRNLATPGVRDRLLAVVLTALASVFLKRSMVHQTNPITVLGVWCITSWMFAIVMLCLVCLTFHLARSGMAGPSGEIDSDRARDEARRSDNVTGDSMLRRLCQIAVIAMLMLAMQGMTIALFQRISVGYALSLFQLGSLVSVYLGYRYFKEEHILRRLVAACIMLVGAIVIITWG